MIFIQNKYTKWYLSITVRGQNRICEAYTEKHHIVPKSLGGTNHKSNLTTLTAREHFICHLLLPRMLESADDRRKMYYALHRMTFSKTDKHDRYIPSRSFEHLRKMIANGLRGRKLSEQAKEKLRSRKVSDETRRKQSESLKGRKFSSESIQRMRDAQKNNPKNPFVAGIEKTPEHCKNISTGKTGKLTKWSTPENRQAVSDGLKRFHENRRRAAST